MVQIDIIYIDESVHFRRHCDPRRADIATRIERAYQLALGRVPSKTERKLLVDYFEAQAADFAGDATAAGKLATGAMKAGPEAYARGAALVCVVRVILNTDNFITRE